MGKEFWCEEEWLIAYFPLTNGKYLRVVLNDEYPIDEIVDWAPPEAEFILPPPDLFPPSMMRELRLALKFYNLFPSERPADGRPLRFKRPIRVALRWEPRPCFGAG